MKNFLILCLLLAGCQSKNEQQSNVTINGREYADSVSVDSTGNRVRVKPSTGRAKINVSGSSNKVEIK